MTNQRWPAEKNIEFINEYKRYECLWDPKHVQYKNRDVREAAYRKIQNVIQMETVKDVIGKIRSLRNTYNYELLKAKKCSTRSRIMGTNKQYISKIPWLPYMDFLAHIDSNTRENTGDAAPNHSQERLVSQRAGGNVTVTQAPRMKRKMKDPLLAADDALEIKSSQHLSLARNDEFDLFAQMIAQQLRQLPLEVALETEEQIFSTIRRQRIQLLGTTQLSSQGGDSLFLKQEPSNSTRYSTMNAPQQQKSSHRVSRSESDYAFNSGAISDDNESTEYNDVTSQVVAIISET